jgi:hypothetical protein
MKGDALAVKGRRIKLVGKWWRRCLSAPHVDDPVITVTCPARIAWHKQLNETGVVMRKLFVLSALVFALVTDVTATVVATTLQSQIAVIDTAY